MARHILKGMAAGLLAGAAASWAMNQFQAMRPRRRFDSGSGPAERESSAGGGGSPQKRQESGEENATVKTAAAISRNLFHHELTDREKQLAGPVVHYGYGAVIGALYGGLAELLPIVRAGMGLPFGFALWLAGDEVAVPALGLAKPPTEYPPEVHADALAAHFMYGITTDVLRRVLRHVL